MGMIMMLTGGARSGKSTYAQRFAANYRNVAYVATAVSTDEEMDVRIEKHKKQRPQEWRTYEEGYDLQKVIGNSEHDVYLIDCMTAYITNLLLEEKRDWEEQDILSAEEQNKLEQKIDRKINELFYACQKSRADFIVVTNEVGMGLVPANSLGRLFRDVSGRVNRMLAEKANEVYLVVSGLLLPLKGGK